MTTQSQQTTVRADVVVEAPVERAFHVFTAEFDKIKPREHNLLEVPIADTSSSSRPESVARFG
jgi:hypothetical protein